MPPALPHLRICFLFLSQRSGERVGDFFGLFKSSCCAIDVALRSLVEESVYESIVKVNYFIVIHIFNIYYT